MISPPNKFFQFIQYFLLTVAQSKTLISRFKFISVPISPRQQSKSRSQISTCPLGLLALLLFAPSLLVFLSDRTHRALSPHRSCPWHAERWSSFRHLSITMSCYVEAMKFKSRRMRIQSVMKLIECVKNNNYLSDALASSFQEYVFNIMTHPVAFQIVACCLQNLGYDHNKFLFKAALKHCVKLSKNRIGNESFKQIILGSANYEREDILLKIAHNSVYLGKHPKGNHVIQFVLEVLDNLSFNEYLCRCLEEHLLELAVDKHGSYVIQKCMQSLGGELLIESILLKFDLSKFERLATDIYGNYVFQTAIEKSKGTWLHYELVVALKQLPGELSTHAYASHVFRFLRKH